MPVAATEMPAFRKPYLGVIRHVRNRLAIKDEDVFDGTSEAEELLDPLFSSIAWRISNLKQHDLTGYDEHGFRYARWWHRTRAQLAVDLRALEISDGELKAGVASYLRRRDIHSDYLDWHCADALTYTEWHSTVKAMELHLPGLTGAVASERSIGWRAIAGLSRGVWVLIKWSVWLAALFVLSENASETGAVIAIVGLVLGTAAFQVRKWRTRDRIRKLVNEMRHVYDLFASMTFSWEVVWQELNRTRALGAVWPGELYRLVEIKKCQITD